MPKEMEILRHEVESLPLPSNKYRYTTVKVMSIAINYWIEDIIWGGRYCYNNMIESKSKEKQLILLLTLRGVQLEKELSKHIILA
jgi:hypothetical protein